MYHNWRKTLIKIANLKRIHFDREQHRCFINFAAANSWQKQQSMFATCRSLLICRGELQRGALWSCTQKIFEYFTNFQIKMSLPFDVLSQHSQQTRKMKKKNKSMNFGCNNSRNTSSFSSYFIRPELASTQGEEEKRRKDVSNRFWLVKRRQRLSRSVKCIALWTELVTPSQEETFFENSTESLEFQ